MVGLPNGLPLRGKKTLFNYFFSFGFCFPPAPGSGWGWKVKKA